MSPNFFKITKSEKETAVLREKGEKRIEREKGGGGGILKNFVEKHSVTYLHTHSPILFSLAASCCCSSYFF